MSILAFRGLPFVLAATAFVAGIPGTAVRSQTVLTQLAEPGRGRAQQGQEDETPDREQQQKAQGDRQRRGAQEQQQRGAEQQREQVEQQRETGRRAQEQQQRAVERERAQTEQQTRRAQEQQRGAEQQREQAEQQRETGRRAQEQQQRAVERERAQTEQQTRRAQEQQRGAEQQREQAEQQRETGRRAQEQQQRAVERERAQTEQQTRRAQEQQRAGEQQQKAAEDQQRRLSDKQKAQAGDAATKPLENRPVRADQGDTPKRSPDVARDAVPPLANPAFDKATPPVKDSATPQRDELLARDQKLKDDGDTQKRALNDARENGDKARILKLEKDNAAAGETDRRLKDDLAKTKAKQDAVADQEGVLKKQVSEEYAKGQADRETRHKEIEKALDREKRAAANENEQKAINDRLRQENEKLKALKDSRREVVDKGGQTIIQEGNRTIYQQNNQIFIQHNENDRFKAFAGSDFRSSQSREGNTISYFNRPDGARVEIETDVYGRPLRRVRILPDGRRYTLFENRSFAAGLGFALGSLIVNLPPPRISIPREEYIVDTERASEDDIYGALEAPPLEPLERTYSLDEVRASVNLRDRMRSVNIDTINFEFGSWEITPDQGVRLENVAAVIKDIVARKPNEVFLVEGHTDAVGSSVDNLSLSDRRAESVASVLSRQFAVPAENLVTQGYGKQFLLVDTPGPERRNRRVTVRRITPLLSSDSSDSQDDRRYDRGRGSERFRP